VAFLATVDYDAKDAFLVRVILVMNLGQLVACTLLAESQFSEGNVDWPSLRMTTMVKPEKVLIFTAISDY